MPFCRDLQLAVLWPVLEDVLWSLDESSLGLLTVGVCWFSADAVTVQCKGEGRSFCHCSLSSLWRELLAFQLKSMMGLIGSFFHDILYLLR